MTTCIFVVMPVRLTEFVLVSEFIGYHLCLKRLVHKCISFADLSLTAVN